MCGLVGLINKSKTFNYAADDMFTDMLRMDSIRGEDSTGAFGVTDEGKHDIIKGDCDGHTFVSSSNYKKFQAKIYAQYCAVIGHNRKATKGTVSPDNAHPFVAKHITLVHNGTIYNQNDLNTEVEVDSHAIAHALADHDCVAALNKIHGAYALIWYDAKDKTINLARNKERPLYLIEYDTYWAIASEPGLPMWLHSRNGIKHKAIMAVPLEKILTFSVKKLGANPIEVPYEEYRYWSAPVAPDVSGVGTNVDWTPAESLRLRHQQPALLQNKLTGAAQRMKEIGLKTGDEILFKAVSYSDPDEKDQVLIGHPVFEDTADGNIAVRAVLNKGETVEQFLRLGHLFSARILNVKPLQGTITYFVRDVTVVNRVYDMNGTGHNQRDLSVVLATGCGRCKKVMKLEDVPKSIVRQKNDGVWRTVCPACVEHSLKEAQLKPNSPETLRLVQ